MTAESSATVLRLLVADDHPATRAGTVAHLSAAPDIEIVGQAADAAETLRLAQALQPDLILSDARMPGLRPAKLVHRLRAVCPQAQVLVLSAYREPALVLGVLRAGAAGYLLKEENLDTVVTAVRGVARGEVWLSPHIARLMTHQAATSDEVLSLTAREREVLQLLVRGRNSFEIGQTLGIAERTVRYHLGNVYGKLGVKSRAEAIALALGRGLVDEF